jgi:uncharacterized Fe-S cluster-containing MiaB family protein
MSTVNIDSRKVAGVVKAGLTLVADKGFSRVEIIVGLAELLGRIIVESSESSIQAEELAKIAHNHTDISIGVGLRATNKTIIGA